MKCCKLKNRNFFNLFKVYSCDSCLYLQKIEVIVIGIRKIVIFKITDCFFDKVTDEFTFFSKKLQAILLLISILEDSIVIWKKVKGGLEKYEFILDAYMDLGYDIYIIDSD